MTGAVACEGEVQGTVVSKKCTRKLADECIRVDIKVKYPNGKVKVHNEQRKLTKDCDKGDKFPKCKGGL